MDENNKGTVFIGNYFEAVYPHFTIPDSPPVTEGGGGENEPEASTPIPQGGITYYYAGSQRIAMRDANGVYFLLSDHLGSSSVVVDANGKIVEEGYYLPWGGERGDLAIELTDYGYTGQMREGDIYFYNARYYDPAIGRFMQADTIVPPTQGTQAFDRYAYVNNNPLRYADPSGHRLWEGDGGGDYNWHYDYVMNLTNLEEREQNARTANAILDATLTVGSILFEPVDWAVTATECVSGDCSAWAMIGLLPLIPGSIGNKLDDFVDVGTHLDGIPLTGQKHHILSKKLWNAMSDPLKTAFGHNRDTLIVQAVDYAAHHGYQAWHRAVDYELVKFLRTYNPTAPQFIDELFELYTEHVDRFPTVLDILNRYRQERLWINSTY